MWVKWGGPCHALVPLTIGVVELRADRIHDGLYARRPHQAFTRPETERVVPTRLMIDATLT
jgi:hypothetical protein